MKKRAKKHSNLETKIYAILSDGTKLWQILDNVAASVCLKSGDLFRVMNESDKFVIAYNKGEKAMIATRDRFRKEEPFINKLIGAFKNRIL